MIVVGLDLHVRNSFLHVEDEAGRRLKRGRVGNSLAEVAEFLGALEPRLTQPPLPLPREPVRVVLESTTNSRAMCGLLHDYARGAGVALSAQVLDARKLRVIAQSVSKCDKLDAAVLAELARSNLKLPVCYVPDDAVFALREHLRARSDLVRIRTMLKNRVHALLHRRGMPPPGDPFSRAGRERLAGLTLDAAGRSILDRYLAQLDALERAVRESTRELRALTCDGGADGRDACGNNDGADASRWRKPLAQAAVGAVHDAGRGIDPRADDPGGAGRRRAFPQPRGGEQLGGAGAGRARLEPQALRRPHHAPRQRAPARDDDRGGVVRGPHAREPALQRDLQPDQPGQVQADRDHRRGPAHAGGRVDDAETR